MSLRLARCCAALALLLGAGTPLGAQAVEATVSLQYKGGAPMQFEHTTPPSSACAVLSSFCRNQHTFSAPVSYSKLTVASKAEPRKAFYSTLPAARRGEVLHEATGERLEVTLDFTRMSQRVASPVPNRNPATGQYAIAPSNCAPQPGLWVSTNQYITRWFFNRSPGSCATRPQWANYDQKEPIEASELSLAYILTTPPPYRFKPGRYSGTIRYTVGMGGDFDFGDNVTDLSDSELVVNIVIDVQHEFRIEFGPNFDHAVLEPPGGWTAWLDGGRVPPKIASDQSLRLWSSGPFRIYKACQYGAGDDCAIRNRRGEQVPLKVSVTMPYGIRYGGWQAVNRRPLPTGRAAALELEAMLHTVNGPGQVHFQVDQDDLRPMLERAGERYSGQVTLVFDAEV